MRHAWHTTAVKVMLLAREQWLPLRDAHWRAVDAWIQPHLARRMRGEKHPVDDFLWDYYPFSTGRLRLWNPGPATALEDHRESDGELPSGFAVDVDGAALFDVAHLPMRTQERLRREVQWVARLLDGVARRPASFGCFGLHEWAMLLGQSPDERRHRLWPLRVSDETLRQTIEDTGLRCTHFDAWRFFTAESLLLNPWTHSRESQPDCDQGGCLHANMDLYKWCMRLQPLVSSALTTDCFGLALRIRQLDMAASPYDFAHLGIVPVPVETAAGRAYFSKQQRGFAQEADVLRARLGDEVQRAHLILRVPAATIHA